MKEKEREKDLLRKLIKLNTELKKATERQKALQADYDMKEAQLLDFLETNEATATAKYEGIGYAMVPKPRLYASCVKENQDKLFAFLKEIARDDLIKTAVPAASLSAFVKQRMENGEECPDFISYYFKTKIKLYPK